MTRHSLRSLLIRAARQLDMAAKRESALRIRQRHVLTAKELRCAADKGIRV